MKLCGRCKTQRSLSEFNKGQTWCRECMKIYKREDRNKKRGGPPREVWRYFDGRIVECRRCKSHKPLTSEFFRKCTSKNNGAHIRKDCRDCLNKDRRDLINRNSYERSYALFIGYKRADEKKGLVCEITAKFIHDNILNKPCIYCGDLNKIGIDRKDSTIGHTEINSVPCCQTCNFTKGTRFTFDEMLNVIGPAIKRVKEARGVNHIPTFPFRYPNGESK